MQLTPPHAVEYEVTASWVGAELVDDVPSHAFEAFDQSTWSLQKSRLEMSSERKYAGEPVGGGVAPSTSDASRLL
jgi:hypothetical protein